MMRWKPITKWRIYKNRWGRDWIAESPDRVSRYGGSPIQWYYPSFDAALNDVKNFQLEEYCRKRPDEVQAWLEAKRSEAGR